MNGIDSVSLHLGVCQLIAHFSVAKKSEQHSNLAGTKLRVFLNCYPKVLPLDSPPSSTQRGNSSEGEGVCSHHEVSGGELV